MFGSANGIIQTNYAENWTKWSNIRTNVYNENLFMYMMNMYLHKENQEPAFLRYAAHC